MTAAPDEVRDELVRLLASGSFASSTRLSRFLRYVVERTLSGDGDRLKEYAIGIDVFDRDERYDPRVDSLVRVEAGRLRAKLAEYYAGAGAGDPVVIRMPRGSYAPVFEKRDGPSPALPGDGEPGAARRSPGRFGRRLFAAGALAAGIAAAAAIAAWRFGLSTANRDPRRPVAIAVLPFSQYPSSPGDEALAARLTDGVTTELARTGALGVVSHTSALQFAGVRRPLKEIARALRADVVLEGTVLLEGDRVRIQTRLVDARTDRKGWVEDFVGDTADLRDLEQRIAASVAAAVRRRGRG